MFYGSDGGKGDTPRKVDKKKFDNNWDAIFGKKDQKDEPEKDDKNTGGNNGD